jgi:hypothetical protein
MYEKMKIQQLENAVRDKLAQSKSSIMEATKILRYLQQTNRYKENARYKKEPFKMYLEDQFSVRLGTYQEWVRALPFEKEAGTYGVGLVSKTIKRCGAAGAKRVFTEINALEELKKSKLIPRDKIEAVIEKHQTPKHMAAIKKEYTDWRAMYQAESEAHEATKQKLKEARKLIAELEDQISKLKVTASIVPQIRHLVETRPAVQ